MKEKIAFCSLKTIEFSFYGLFFLVPLVLSNNTSELFELNKMWLTWGFTVVVLSSWIVKMLAEGQLKIKRTPLDIPILLFLLGQFLATIFSQDPHISLWGYYSRFNGGFYSTLSYVILYYAFVSNFAEVSSLRSKKPYSLMVRLGLLLGGLTLLALSLPLSAPADATSQGQGFIFFTTLAIVLALAIAAFRGQFFNRLLMVSLFSAFIVVLWGIPSHFGTDATCYLFRGSFATDCWTESFQPTVRIFSTIGQPAWLAAYLAFLIPVAFALSLRPIRFLKSPFTILKNSQSFIFFTLALLFYIGLLFANTRGGFLGFWLGNVVFWAGFILLFKEKFKNALKLALFVNLTLLLLTFILGIPITQLQQYTLPNLAVNTSTLKANAQAVGAEAEGLNTEGTETERLSAPEGEAIDPQQPAQQTGGTPQEAPELINITESGNIRLNVWQGAIDAFKANPILGTGVETFAFAYYRYKPPSQNLTSEWDFLYNKAHNEYLNYLATTGIVGLGTYLLMIFWFLFLVARLALRNSWLNSAAAYEEDRDIVSRRLLILALTAGYITILVSNFFGFSVVIVNLLFFLTPALVYVLDANFGKTQSLLFPSKSDTEKETVSALKLTAIAFIILIALYLLLLLFRYWQADKEYALGANLNRIGEYLTARTYLENAVKLRSGEPTFRDELAFNSAAVGTGYVQQNDVQNAQVFIKEAEDLSNSVVQKHPNNVVFWKNRVRLYALLSQADPRFLTQALDSIQKANALAPSDAKILYNYGVILGQSGNVNDGIVRLNEAVKLKPDYRDAYFALALFYRDQATGGTERVADPEMQQKAEDALNFILEKINPNDTQAKETLQSWGS